MFKDNTILLVVTNPLVGLDPVLRDRKVEFKGYFCGYAESYRDHNSGATMGTPYHHIRDPKGGGRFRGNS